MRQNCIRLGGENLCLYRGARCVAQSTLEKEGPVLPDVLIFNGKLEKQVLLWNIGNSNFKTKVLEARWKNKNICGLVWGYQMETYTLEDSAYTAAFIPRHH